MELAATAVDLALEETRDVAEEHRIPRSTLQQSLGRLLADQRQVRRDADGTPCLLDPLFGEWMRRR